MNLHEQVKHLVKTEQRLYQTQNELERQIARINALNRFALSAGTHGSVSPLLEASLRLLSELYLLDWGIALWRGEDGELRVLARLGSPPEDAASRAREAAANVDSESARLEQGDGKGGEVRLFLPLRRQGALLGLLAVGKEHAGVHSFHELPPTAKDLPFIHTIGHHFNSALESALYRHELAELASQLEHKVTERTQQLLQTSKMSALGQMAGGLAHEINNPLAIIKALADHLKRSLERGRLDHATAMEIAGRITSTVERIAKIVSSLRAFARDGSQDPLESVAVTRLIEETLGFCRERFRKHDVALEVDPIPEDARIACRPVEVSQVLLNLLNNAFDAVEKLPEKRVRVSVALAGAGCWEIAVSDNGPGVPAETRERIFQPFFTTKESGKGTGLGLSVSRGIIERHRGEIFLDESASGTRFCIRLPAAPATSESEKGGKAAS